MMSAHRQTSGAKAHAQIIIIVLFFSLSGCAITQETPRASPTDPVDPLPPAESVRAQEPVTPQRSDPLVQLRKRLKQIGKGDLLAVRAHVQKMSVSRRKLPSELHWGPFPHVITTLQLRVTQTYCGATNDSVTVSYVGGTMDDGTTEVTELTPQILSPGMEHIFFLRRLHGEYFLELGRVDMLWRSIDGRFMTASAESIELKYLREACP